MNKLGTTHVRRVVDRILDEPALTEIVARLEPPAIRKLVEHVGLEDAGDVVALLSPAQLERVFDEDLWRSVRPGDDETFDADRFALWLAVLLDAGEASAIRTVAALDEDLLALGLASAVLVIDVDAMAVEMSSERGDDHDQLEKALESCLYEELEEFRVVARDASRWDAVLTVLVGLDRDHHALLRRVLERVAAMTATYVEENGDLHQVLTSMESLADDVGGARMERREAEGYVAPSDALAFLRLTMETPLEEIVAARELDPVSRGHAARSERSRRRVVARAPVDAVSRRAEAFVAELARADATTRPDTSPRRLAAASSGAPSKRPALEDAMTALRASDPAKFAAHLEELAFLVNAIVAVVGGEARLTPTEATRVALSIGSLGLAHVARTSSPRAPDRALEDGGPIRLFRVGLKLVADGDRWTRAAFEGWSARAAELASDASARRDEGSPPATKRKAKASAPAKPRR